MIEKSEWFPEQKWESEWWGKCLNTFNEEKKQIAYAMKMGLRWVIDPEGRSPYYLDIKHKKILDIGGGPTSLLLKGLNKGKLCTVVDPLTVPTWVWMRYTDAEIRFFNLPAEEINIEGEEFDEVWIYNCLQHTINPEKIIKKALELGKIIRIFEWLDTPKHTGHPHTLTEENLNSWLGGYGRVELLDGLSNCYGKAYYGIFPSRQT